MKRLGILVIGRDYFVPYVEWLMSMDGKLFNISGCVDNDYTYCDQFGARYEQYRTSSINNIVHECDLILSLGYWNIIPEDVIKSVPMGILNLHHSYKLRYRGRHTCTWAIINDEKTHGTTLHYMTKTLDDGPILASREVPILESDTATTLFKRTNDAGLEMLKETLPIALDKKRLSKVKLETPDQSYRMYRQKDLSHEIPLEIMNDHNAFSRHVRALTFQGAPRPYITIKGTRIYVSAEDD